MLFVTRRKANQKFGNGQKKFQNMKPMEKLNTFFLRSKMMPWVLSFPSRSTVTKPLDMLCRPYSNEKSKNTRLMLMPKPAMRLKLKGVTCSEMNS